MFPEFVNSREMSGTHHDHSPLEGTVFQTDDAVRQIGIPFRDQRICAGRGKLLELGKGKLDPDLSETRPSRIDTFRFVIRI